MPYKIIGNTVYHMKDGKWSVKQHATSHANAVEAMRLLNAVEHGWKPTGKTARSGRTAKKIA